MTDWPTLIARLEARGIDVPKRLHVSRVTVWRWAQRVSRPSGDHAVALVRMDASEATQAQAVTPM